MEEIWVAEYSPSQKAFHRQLLRESAKSNFVRTIKKEFPDWIIIGYGNQKECGEFIELARKYLHP